MGVPFNYDSFVAAFPGLRNVNADEALGYWTMANAWFDNNGWPGTIPIAATAMNLLTAHLIWLFSNRDPNGNPSSTATALPPALVGRIDSATEGSVSVHAEYELNSSPNEAWFNQTRFGAAYWAMTAPYHTALYIPPHTPPVGPNPWYPAMLPPWPTW